MRQAREATHKHDAKSKLEDKFASDVERFRLPAVEREFLFADEVGRRWRFDFYWPQFKVGVDIHGLVDTSRGFKGGHQTFNGMRNDMDKANAAAMLGYAYLVFCQGHVLYGDAIAVTQRVLITRGWDGTHERSI